MALFETFKAPCTLLERTKAPDGEGGWKTTWADGAGFMAAMVLSNSINARVAEAEGVTGVYTVTADRGLGLSFHDAFRRETDGKTFRIVKALDPTPGAASFQFDQYQAEEWPVPDGDWE